jgi:hypothetical protein
MGISVTTQSEHPSYVMADPIGQGLNRKHLRRLPLSSMRYDMEMPINGLAHFQGGQFAGITTRSVSFEVALFVAITTRSVSEGRSYVACDVFPHVSLAHASGCENPWQASDAPRMAPLLAFEAFFEERLGVTKRVTLRRILILFWGTLLRRHVAI